MSHFRVDFVARSIFKPSDVTLLGSERPLVPGKKEKSRVQSFSREGRGRTEKQKLVTTFMRSMALYDSIIHTKAILLSLFILLK